MFMRKLKKQWLIVQEEIRNNCDDVYIKIRKNIYEVNFTLKECTINIPYTQRSGHKTEKMNIKRKILRIDWKYRSCTILSSR
jgi:hypothetical protein